jgi:nucleoside-diphosphate-sugar epimerase
VTSLFCFGLGYSALALIEEHRSRLNAVAGTVRTAERAAALRQRGIRALVMPEEAGAIAQALREAEAVLVSIAPDPEGDPVLAGFTEALSAAPGVRWIGYLSTIGVYGDRAGAWVDETTPPAPGSARSRQRAGAEAAWLAFGTRSGKPVHLFRLAGIYGPGRNALRALREGTAKRVVKEGQVFNRIHVDDIARALAASLDRPRAGAVYNVADDEPAPPQEVVAYAAGLLGIAPPPETPYDPAAMTPMAASFYAENKRAANALIKRELGIAWRYPTYREGLAALLAVEE